MDGLKDCYAAHTGKVSDKWLSFFPIYEPLFAQRRLDPVSILEIGIQNGGSLEIYAKYFANAELILGCDINPKCSGLAFADPRIRVIVGDANSDFIQAQITQQCASFEIVIDDGSHTSGDIVQSFARYFKHVAAQGVYVVEDLVCSYWREYAGGLHDPYSSMNFLKGLADVVNHEHWGVPLGRKEFLQGFADRHQCSFSEEDLACIHSVQFHNSCCVIRKDHPSNNTLGPRVVIGEEELVFPGLKTLHGTELAIPSQEGNPFAAGDAEGQAADLTRHLHHSLDTIRMLHEQLAVMLLSRSWRYTAPLRWVMSKLRDR